MSKASVRLTYLCVLVLLFSQCKFVESSTAQTTKMPKSAKESTLSPVESLVNAKVLREMEPGIYSIRIYEVKEVGFGYSQELSAGDKINVKIPLPLEVDEVRDLVIRWVENAAGGYYEVKTGAE
ncbi:MAG: hypothetical protein ACJA08_003107 [Cyclobacteriaceae bacterium]|jgi:hypothetical protein